MLIVYTALHRCILPCYVYTGRRRHGAPQSALSHSRSTKFPSVQHDKLWPTNIFVRLELTAITSATTTSIDLFKRSLKTFLFGQISRSGH